MGEGGSGSERERRRRWNWRGKKGGRGSEGRTVSGKEEVRVEDGGREDGRDDGWEGSRCGEIVDGKIIARRLEKRRKRRQKQ